MIDALLQTVGQHVWYAILVLAFLVVILVQMIYYWMFFSRLAFHKPRKVSDGKPPVSVIVLARNQYNDLLHTLPVLLGQDYPEFEVLVADDNSDDGSDELLEKLTEQHANLRVVKLTQSLNWFKGRKFPLSLGIKSANHDVLLLTDIQFRPAGKNWISELAGSYSENTEIVLGYATYDTSSKLNKWLRFMAFYDGLVYLSMALSGRTFKGIGSNLSYRKSLFYRHKGFSSHYVINAGDDELFVNRTATGRNVRIQVSGNSMVKSAKPVSLLQWLAKEKTRLSIRRYFKFSHRALISVFSTSTFLFYLIFILLLLLQIQWPVVVGLFAVRFISQMIIFVLAQKRLSEKNLLLLSPFFEVILVLVDLFIWIRLLLSKKSTWN
jgi:cellulose synthase/poly-beta-1,6-N-acetylglucosamine synthase-like glycosyltransferase